MPQRSGINRGLMWLRKVFEITEETDSPRVLSEQVRPIVDTFGWERLPEAFVITDGAGDPAVAVASEATPANTLRLILGASLEHSDVATHQTWMVKRTNPGALDVGIPTDRTTLDAGEFMSMIGNTYTVEGDFIVAEMTPAPTAGQMTLRLRVIDLPFGEYIPPL